MSSLKLFTKVRAKRLALSFALCVQVPCSSLSEGIGACGRRGGVLEVGFKGACKEVSLVGCVVRPVAVFVLEGGDGGWEGSVVEKLSV